MKNITLLIIALIVLPCSLVLSACDSNFNYKFWQKENGDNELVIAIYEEKIASYKAEIEQLTLQASSLNGDILSLNSQIALLLIQIQENSSEEKDVLIASLKETIDEHLASISQKNSIIAGLQNFVSELENQAAILGVEANKVLSLNKQIEDLLEIVAQQNAVMLSLQNAIIELQKPQTFMATFYLSDGVTVWDIQVIESNGSPVAPELPSGAEGWSTDGNNILNLSTYQVNANVSFYAVMLPSFVVTFMVNDNVWDTQNVYKNSFALLPYEPDKFMGWSLDGETIIDVTTMKITQSTVFYAVVITRLFGSISLSADSWETISKVSASGYAQEHYYIGEEKTIVLSTNEQVTLLIVGFNHDVRSDGSGKAGITFGMKNLLQTTAKHFESSSMSSYGWDNSLIRSAFLPSIMELLPVNLKNVICAVDKTTTYYKSEYSSEKRITSDLLWLFAQSEVYGVVAEGAQYEYYKQSTNRIKKLSNGSGAASSWLLRSFTSSNKCYNTSSNGDYYSGYITTVGGVCFGFAV